MDYGSSANCWPRVRDWQQDGAWERLRSVLVSKLRAADYLGFPRVVVNHDSVISALGRINTGPNLTDRAHPRFRHHLVPEANGTPPAAILTVANRYDVTQLAPLVAAIPLIVGYRTLALQMRQFKKLGAVILLHETACGYGKPSGVQCTAMWPPELSVPSARCASSPSPR